MLPVDDINRRIEAFKAQHGLSDEANEKVVATIHLKNSHPVDLHGAQDRTSTGSSDHGIDAWFFDPSNETLHVYQSKLSGAKGTATKGFLNLCEAAAWLNAVLNSGDLGDIPSNKAIYNLAKGIADFGPRIRNLRFVLISPFHANELEGSADFSNAQTDLAKSAINLRARDRGGRIDLRAESYRLEGGAVPPPEAYPLRLMEGTLVSVAKKTRLQLTYTSLRSLVELFRRRGNLAFEKNVRYYLNTKEAKRRLEHPLEETLAAICDGRLDPNIFPFYHVGITISASDCESIQSDAIELNTPNIINGCQTVSIASRFLGRLEKAKATDQIERFDSIRVIAKIVTRASDDQLREIANANNRQNPIENWQLFCNDPIHIEIESALRDIGIFYERQKGKFEADMPRLQTLGKYPNTNGAFVSVQDLGQLICLSRREIALAAKPSDVFADKQRHDQVFEDSIPAHCRDIVWAYNAQKAVKRALMNYLRSPTHDNEQTHFIFNRPNVKQNMHYIGLMNLYQRCGDVAPDFARSLNKKAPPSLVDQAEQFFKRVIKKTKDFYLADSSNLETEVSGKKLEAFVTNLCRESGLDSDGAMPFGNQAHDWDTLLSDDAP